MKQEDIKFCQEHIINFESVKLGFTRNIPFNVLGEYERMYRDYLDPQFSLTYWCGECVFDMLNRLIRHYEVYGQNAQPNVQSLTLQTEEKSKDLTLQQQEEINKAIGEFKPKKRGRPKK